MKKRLPPDERHRQILKAAVRQAEIKGFDSLTLKSIAKRAKVTHGLIGHYFNDIKSLRRAVMNVAIEKKILKIIAYGLALNHIKTKELGPKLCDEVIEFMTQGE